VQRNPFSKHLLDAHPTAYKVLTLRVSEEGFSFYCKRKEGCFRQSQQLAQELLIYQAVT
jgi:hypothetical protein